MVQDGLEKKNSQKQRKQREHRPRTTKGNVSRVAFGIDAMIVQHSSQISKKQLQFRLESQLLFDMYRRQ